MTIRSKVLLWLGLGAVLVCGLGVTIPLWLILNGRDNLGGALVDYRRHGLPWTAKEVNPDGPVADADNAAPTLDRALVGLSGTHVTNDVSAAWKLFAGGNDAAARALVAKYSSALEMAKSADRFRLADFRKDWDLGPEVVFPELPLAKNAVKLLAMRAVLEARAGNVAASNGDLGDAWALGRLVGQEPVLLGVLVQVAMRAFVLSGVEEVVAAYRSRPGALAALKGQLATMTDGLDFRRSVRGEAYMGLAILRNEAIFRSRIASESTPDTPSTPIDPRQLQRTGSPGGLFARVMGGKLINSYVRLADIAHQDVGNPMRLDSDLAEFDKEVTSDRSFTGSFRSILAPAFAGVGQVIVSDQARLVTTSALVDALLLHARTGRYPATMAELPGESLDPFDGKPLRIKVRGDSIRIYSVGPNERDDGGVSRGELRSTSSDAYDVVAAYPPVKSTR
ncbi:MAG: hypothetical protein ACYC96_03590 [Fimbriimonadaceae bacterium]